MTSSSAGPTKVCRRRRSARTLPAVDLRRATRADAPVMADIATAAYAPYLERMGGLRPGPMDTDYGAAVADAEAWVALLDDGVVGFVLLVEEPDGLLLENVAVLPAHHGRGIGRRLLEQAERRAVELGRDRIRLCTHVTMVENHALYDRIGYAETARTSENGFTRVFYEKRL